jgi:hypothetical protein
MFKYLKIIIIALVFGFLSLGGPNTGSAAISLQFDPMNQSVNLGNQASVNFLLTGAGSTDIGAIDFWVNYDPSVVLFNSIVWGTTLGNPTSFTDINTDDLLNPGSVDQIGISAGWDPAQLPNSDSFSLFTMIFDTVGVGTTGLSLTDAFSQDANATDLFSPGNQVRDSFLFSDSDQNFNIVLADDIQPGSITVSSTKVPEPGTALLLGLGLAALASMKKKTS